MNAASTILVPSSTPRRFRARPRNAFTLIEVLATLLLIAIVLPCIMHGYTLSTLAATISRHRTEAGALAESKLNELIGTNQWQTAQQGDFNPDWPDYTWSSEVNPWGQGQGVQGANVVQQLDVHVTWKLATGDQTVTVSSLVYQSANATTSGITGGFP
jgi:prepilin-type N-terminal cleavage/methylation domain-containing protein